MTNDSDTKYEQFISKKNAQPKESPKSHLEPHHDQSDQSDHQNESHSKTKEC